MQTQPKYVTVSNDGAQDVELDVIPPTTEDWTVDTSESKLLLGAGETTRIAVLFAPKSSGPKGESIDIRLTGTMVSLVKIDLDGTGVKAPTVPMDMGSGCHMTGSAHAHGGPSAGIRDGAPSRIDVTSALASGWPGTTDTHVPPSIVAA